MNIYSIINSMNMVDKIFLCILLISYIIEFILLPILKEEIKILYFIPLINIIVAESCILCLIFKMLQLIKIKSKNEYQLKQYKGFYYLSYNNKNICENSVNIDFKSLNGFCIPNSKEKIIYFENLADINYFIKLLDSKKVLDKLV